MLCRLISGGYIIVSYIMTWAYEWLQIPIGTWDNMIYIYNMGIHSNSYIYFLTMG